MDEELPDAITGEDLALWHDQFKNTMGNLFPVGRALRLIAEVRRLRAAFQEFLSTDAPNEQDKARYRRLIHHSP